MSIFYHEDEQSPNPSKRCKYLAACLTDAFANCHTGRKLSVSSRAEECLTSDFDEEQEVIVSAIRSRAMEKLRRKPRSFSDSFSFVYSSKSGDLFITQKGVEKQEDHEDDEKADFLSVASCLSCCSSDAASRDVFLSVKTSFSRCSSLNGIEFRDFPKQSIIQQFRHCEGWPFGLCRKDRCQSRPLSRGCGKKALSLLRWFKVGAPPPPPPTKEVQSSSYSKLFFMFR